MRHEVGHVRHRAVEVDWQQRAKRDAFRRPVDDALDGGGIHRERGFVDIDEDRHRADPLDRLRPWRRPCATP